MRPDEHIPDRAPAIRRRISARQAASTNVRCGSNYTAAFVAAEIPHDLHAVSAGTRREMLECETPTGERTKRSVLETVGHVHDREASPSAQALLAACSGAMALHAAASPAPQAAGR